MIARNRATSIEIGERGVIFAAVESTSRIAAWLGRLSRPQSVPMRAILGDYWSNPDTCSGVRRKGMQISDQRVNGGYLILAAL
jgi:hypothetical protein